MNDKRYVAPRKHIYKTNLIDNSGKISGSKKYANKQEFLTLKIGEQNHV